MKTMTKILVIIFLEVIPFIYILKSGSHIPNSAEEINPYIALFAGFFVTIFLFDSPQAKVVSVLGSILIAAALVRVLILSFLQ